MSVFITSNTQPWRCHHCTISQLLRTTPRDTWTSGVERNEWRGLKYGGVRWAHVNKTARSAASCALDASHGLIRSENAYTRGCFTNLSSQWVRPQSEERRLKHTSSKPQDEKSPESETIKPQDTESALEPVIEETLHERVQPQIRISRSTRTASRSNRRRRKSRAKRMHISDPILSLKDGEKNSIATPQYETNNLSEDQEEIYQRFKNASSATRYVMSMALLKKPFAKALIDDRHPIGSALWKLAQDNQEEIKAIIRSKRILSQRHSFDNRWKRRHRQARRQLYTFRRAVEKSRRQVEQGIKPEHINFLHMSKTRPSRQIRRPKRKRTMSSQTRKVAPKFRPLIRHSFSKPRIRRITSAKAGGLKFRRAPLRKLPSRIMRRSRFLAVFNWKKKQKISSNDLSRLESPQKTATSTNAPSTDSIKQSGRSTNGNSLTENNVIADMQTSGGKTSGFTKDKSQTITEKVSTSKKQTTTSDKSDPMMALLSMFKESQNSEANSVLNENIDIRQPYLKESQTHQSPVTQISTDVQLPMSNPSPQMSPTIRLLEELFPNAKRDSSTNHKREGNKSISSSESRQEIPRLPVQTSWGPPKGSFDHYSRSNVSETNDEYVDYYHPPQRRTESRKRIAVKGFENSNVAILSNASSQLDPTDFQRASLQKNAHLPDWRMNDPAFSPLKVIKMRHRETFRPTGNYLLIFKNYHSSYRFFQSANSKHLALRNFFTAYDGKYRSKYGESAEQQELRFGGTDHASLDGLNSQIPPPLVSSNVLLSSLATTQQDTPPSYFPSPKPKDDGMESPANLYHPSYHFTLKPAASQLYLRNVRYPFTTDIAEVVKAGGYPKLMHNRLSPYEVLILPHQKTPHKVISSLFTNTRLRRVIEFEWEDESDGIAAKGIIGPWSKSWQKRSSTETSSTQDANDANSWLRPILLSMPKVKDRERPATRLKLLDDPEWVRNSNKTPEDLAGLRKFLLEKLDEMEKLKNDRKPVGFIISFEQEDDAKRWIDRWHRRDIGQALWSGEGRDPDDFDDASQESERPDSDDNHSLIIDCELIW